ncbi:MAG: hypothetical protein GQ532_02165 [Methylomarinum sp.]|nr:hypothetical protein [Methylomarinum sp.]
MNISNNGNQGLKPVVANLHNHINKKLGLKRYCLCCFYLFTPKNQSVCYCGQCSYWHGLYRKLQATKTMLAAGGVYGYH